MPLPQIASKSMSVGELFSSPFHFIAPNFQRPYSWDVENASRLLFDLQLGCASGANEIYFLGAILLVCSVNGDDSKAALIDGAVFAGAERVFAMVDGQQRLVTLALLLAGLRDLLGRDSSASAALVARLTSALTLSAPRALRIGLRGADHEFLHHCICEPGATLVPPVSEPATAAQQNLLAVIDLFNRQLQMVERAELEQLATFVLDNCTLVCVATSTIDRAYHMFSVLNEGGKKLSRADILKAELIGKASISDHARLTAIWDDAERRLGADFGELFSYVRKETGRGNEKIIEAIRGQVAEMPGGPSAFITKVIEPAARIVDIILRYAHEGTPQSAEINRYLRVLGWYNSRDWVSPLLAYWVRHGANAPALLGFIKALDRYVIGARIQGHGADKRAKRLVACVSEIVGGASAAGPWPSLECKAEETRAISNNLRDLHKRSPQACKAVLLRLNEHFGDQPVPDTVKLTIEHILPVKTAANSKWREKFPDHEDRMRKAASIGNLVLVTQTVNDRAANHDFALKSAAYFDSGSQHICKLANELRGLSDFGPVELAARQARMEAAIKEMWGFVL